MSQYDANGVDITDTLGHALVAEDLEHKHIHDGYGFRVSKLVSLTNGATAYLQIKTGARNTHLKQVGLALDLNVVLCTFTESPVITDGTTAVPVINAHRQAAVNNPSVNKVFSDPTSVSGGTALDIDLVPAGTLGSRGPAQLAPSSTEFILKPNTNYVLTMTNQGSTTCQLMVKWVWYELP